MRQILKSAAWPALVLVVLVSCESERGAAAAQAPREARAASQEFAGPFPSWTNIKTAYGAVGDGKADDTAALQRGIRELGTNGHSPVLFVPAGQYRITGTLTLEHQIYLSVIGEDPATTSIVWDGPRGGTMLVVNGLAYSRFNRVTFDGRRKAAIAVDQSYDNAAPHFDTGNEYADDVFTDVEFGIRGGFKGHGFAETSIVRARFLRNTRAGVALGNFNALDIWIWDSLFEDCGIGVTNDPGAGNYHVYGSVFRGSHIADMSIQNTGGFSARGNYSIGSRAFFVSGPTINHPASIEIQGNTIIDPRETTAIRLGNQGPGLLIDNVIRSLAGAQAPVVWWKSLVGGADVASAGNTFTTASAFDVNGRHVSVGDRVVPRSEIEARETRFLETPPNNRRRVLEVPRGADAAAIQALVDEATSISGARTVVHIPHGEYSIDRTIVVPPSDVQIVGDGPLSVLRWTGSGRGPVMAIDGPTRAALQAFRIDCARTADGILIANVDQKGARIFGEGMLIRAPAEVGLLVDRLKNAVVELVDFGHGSAAGVSVKVTAARATIFSGASSNSALSYDVSDGGDLLVSDMWYEGQAAIGFARARGSARLTMRGLRIAIPADRPNPAIDIADLDGAVTLLSSGLDDRIGISGQSATGRVLALGLTREFRTSPFFANTGNARAVMVNSRQRFERQGLLTSGAGPVADVGTASPDFLREMLTRTRESRLPSQAEVPADASSLTLYRVFVDNGRNNVVVTGRNREGLNDLK